jgi:protein involved in polysaccharide export with SLBB domain
MLDGDSLYIPSKPHTVLVTGEINNPGFLSFIEGEDVLDYIDRAGGLTDSSNYAVLIKPTGESRRVDFGLFSSNPSVPEGSVIEVLKVAAPVAEGRPVDIAATIKDTFAILTSAATIAFIVWQVTK